MSYELMITEYLWGDWISGSITPTNPSNMIDLVFNDAVGSWAMALGNVRYTSIQNTIEANYGVVQRVLCRIRFRTQGLLNKNSIQFNIKGAEASWTLLEKFSVLNQPPTTLTTKEYDVTSILNSISQINAANFSFDCALAGGGSETTIEVDEVQLVIEKRGFNVFETRNVIENVLLLPRIALETFEIFNLIESVNIYSGVNLPAFDNISIDEAVKIILTVLNFQAEDSSILTEDLVNYLGVLNIDIIEPFHCLITEHVDILDLMVEVGVVMEAIYAQDIGHASLDQLFIKVEDSKLITEYFSDYISALNISLGQDIAIDEFVREYLNVLNISPGEYIGIGEYSKAYLDILSVMTLDFINLTETIEVLDLIVELMVISSINTFDIADIILQILFIDIAQDITASQFLAIENPNIWLESLDTITVQEYTIPGIIIEIKTEEDIGITEYHQSLLSGLYIGVITEINIIEWIDVLDLIIELTRLEIIAISDQRDIVVSPLIINTQESLTVGDEAQVHDVIIELFTDESILVLDSLITGEDVYGEDWAFLTGALREEIYVEEQFINYIDRLLFKEYEVIDIVEYFFIISFLQPFTFESMLLAESISFDLRIEFLLQDKVAIQEASEVYYPIFKLVYDDVFIEEFHLEIVLYWDLYPRIFIVQPRHRIFLRYKKAFPHRYQDYEMRSWHRFEKEESYR